MAELLWPAAGSIMIGGGFNGPTPPTPGDLTTVPAVVTGSYPTPPSSAAGYTAAHPGSNVPLSTMTAAIRLATWNVERPRPSGWKIAPAQRQRMAEVAADIWVLTETHVDHAPTPDHRHAVFSPPHPERRPDHERWTAIWSRWPLEEIGDPPGHRRGSVAAVVHAPLGRILVYGTVIAYANERHFDDGATAGMWQVHLAEITRQGAEWKQLRARHPGLPMVVAGDFNQDRDGSGWYGTRKARAHLGEALAAAGLLCVTTLDVEREGLVAAGHLVDHICLSGELVQSTQVSCWDRFDETGARLSDHPTVAADFRFEDV